MGSLRARMTLVLVAVITALTAASAALFYVVVERSARDAFDAALLEEARTYAAMTEFDVEDGLEFELPVHDLPQRRGPEGAPLQLGIWDDAGAAIVESTELAEHRGRARSREPVFFDISTSAGPARAVALRVTARVDESLAEPPPALALVLARGTAGMERMLSSLYLWFWSLALLGITASALLIGFVVHRALRPLARVAAEVGRIDDRHLSRRLADAGLPSELQPLVRRVNALLDDLERAFTRERQFTADAAHELRTPLSVLRTTAELALSRERDAPAYREALAESLETVLTMQRFVENLLLLARAELDAGEGPREPVALGELVRSTWAQHEARARARGLELRDELAPELVVEADETTLRIVASNLLANAVEYTEEGGWIRVRARPEAGLLLEVGDSGPPLARDELERVFDRLWRGDEARGSDGVHCGIGLAVARALCQAMGCTLTAHTEGQALFFRVRRAPERG